MRLFDMMTTEDIKRIKELDNSLSIALEINDKSQRENKDLRDKIKEAGKINQLHQELCEKLKEKVSAAEGETSIVKGIGLNSPEMKALRKEIEKLKADLARTKEDHQYDNLVHQKELKDLRKK